MTGLCCPVELSSVLSASFERTDKELLNHLEGALAPKTSCGATTRTLKKMGRKCLLQCSITLSVM